ncbi:MAG: U32 family peptidase, partial [Candidatus Woesearchaeota archaeon]|nr:U32 family peptidase [Candidatus Woesearchaeota archaeon]
MKPELLAPVGDWETLSSAIKAGADAVYFGIKWINMRAGSARNFDITELQEVMDKLHKNKVRGYLTLNTVIY